MLSPSADRMFFPQAFLPDFPNFPKQRQSFLMLAQIVVSVGQLRQSSESFQVIRTEQLFQFFHHQLFLLQSLLTA